MSGSGEVDLLDFLLARFAEDTAAAQDCAAVYPPPWDLSDRGWVAYVKADAPIFHEVTRLDQGAASEGGSQWTGEALEHIARWDPARVLAECQAKRRIVEDALFDVRVARHRPAWTMPDEGLDAERRAYRQGAENQKAKQLPDVLDRVERLFRRLAEPFAGHPDFRAEWRS